MTAILIIVLIIVVIFAVVMLTGGDDGEGTAPAPDVTISEEAAGVGSVPGHHPTGVPALVRPVT